MKSDGLDNYLDLVAKADSNPEDWAYVPDKEKPSTWKLNISDAIHVGGAVAALGPGYRGEKVQIPSSALAAVKRKVLSAWHKFHPDAKPEDVPNVIKGETMTPDEMASELTQLKGQLEETSKRADRFEAVAKLSAEERAVFEKLDATKQDEYLAGDAAVRKALTPVETKKDDDGGQDEVQKKLDDQRIEFQKKLDDVKKEADERITKAENIAKAERDAREKTEFEKRADTELANYPGTAVEKGALLRALHNAVHTPLTKEALDGLSKLLAAGNEALSKMTEQIGTDHPGGTTGTNAEAKMEGLVAKYMADKKCDYGTAWLEVGKANKQLYDEIDKARGKQ